MEGKRFINSFVAGIVLVSSVGLSEIGHNSTQKYARLEHIPTSELPVNWGGRAIVAVSTTSGATITITTTTS